MSGVDLFSAFVVTSSMILDDVDAVSFFHQRGIAWAPACGVAMAELVLEGECKSVNLQPFDPSRFTQRLKTGRGRKRQGADVGEQW